MNCSTPRDAPTYTHGVEVAGSTPLHPAMPAPHNLTKREVVSPEPYAYEVHTWAITLSNLPNLSFLAQLPSVRACPSILGAHLKEGQLGHALQGRQQATDICCADPIVVVQKANVAQRGEACKHFALWPCYLCKPGGPIGLLHLLSMLAGICIQKQSSTDNCSADWCVYASVLQI